MYVDGRIDIVPVDTPKKRIMPLSKKLQRLKDLEDKMVNEALRKIHKS